MKCHLERWLITISTIVFPAIPILMFMAISGCGYQPDYSKYKAEAIKPLEQPLVKIDLKTGEYGRPFGVWLMEIDGCEYLVTRVSGGVSMSHKGNCRFCREATKVLR